MNQKNSKKATSKKLYKIDWLSNTVAEKWLKKEKRRKLTRNCYF